jgi:hypothetical protein
MFRGKVEQNGHRGFVGQSRKVGELEDRYGDRLSFIDFLIGEMLQNVLMNTIFPRFIFLLCVHTSAGVG